MRFDYALKRTVRNGASGAIMSCGPQGHLAVR